MKLNKIEKLKLQLSPWEYYRTKFLQLSGTEIEERDIFYLKNFGIYTTKQNPQKFMLRLRFDHKDLTWNNFELILNNITENTKLLITARGQLELHNLEFEEARAMHLLFKQSGLTSCQTLTDNIRALVSDPLYDVAKNSVFAVAPLIEEMKQIFLEKRQWCGTLPRKFNTAIAANKTLITSFWNSDCYFALAKKGRNYGFKLLVGGKNNEFAIDCGIFVQYKEVVPLYHALLHAYKKYGLRANRSRARLFHLIDMVGIDTFTQFVQEYYPKKIEGGGELVVDFHPPTKEWFELQDGSWAFRYFTKFGEVTKEELEDIFAATREYNATIRLGIDQNIYIIGLPKMQNFLPGRSHSVLACAGSKYCIYSLFDTKEGAATLPIERLNKHNIIVGYSGCLKGCARHSAADIGFVGIRTNQFGKVERGVRLFLGALHTQGTSTARLIFWAVPLRKLNDLLQTLLDFYEESGYESFERFCENELMSYEPQVIAYYLLLRMKGEEVKIQNLQSPCEEEFLALQKELFS